MKTPKIGLLGKIIIAIAVGIGLGLVVPESSGHSSHSMESSASS